MTTGMEERADVRSERSKIVQIWEQVVCIGLGKAVKRVLSWATRRADGRLINR